MFEDDLEDEDVIEPLTIEEMADALQDEAGLEVEVRGREGRKTIFVLTEDPAATRDYIRNEVAEDLDLDVIVPRKTRKGGFQIQLMQQGSDEVFTVKMVKGGQHQRGRKNELGFQNFIRGQLEKNGECHLHVEDDYGKTVDLDVVGVMDTANQRGKTKRSDTTLRLKDGSLYGISHKKTNACFVAKVKRVLAEIRFSLEQKVRGWARENGIEYDGKTYLSARITNREFIDLCWFGTDIAQGAAFIGDFEKMDSANVHIQRIIENGDTDVLTSFPIYMVWKAVNRNFTLKTQGVCVRPMGITVDSDLELPGINAPIPSGKRFRTGLEEPKKRKRRRRRRRKVTEDLVEEDELMEEARQNDMWDTVAYCAENHKMLWLKYETVEDGEIISRKVAPYSYRTRNTKVRGRSTYFYADDFTPGQEHGIKCFLIENCLQVKESKQSFTPRWPVEIRQEIDRLERQRADDERKKAELDKGMEDDGEIVDDVPSDDVSSDDVKPTPKPARSATPMKNPEKEPQPKPALKKPEEKPVPTKDKPEVSEPKEVEEKPVEEPKKEPTPSSEPEEEEPSADNTVNLDSDKNEVQVTDDDGNVVKENWLKL